MTFEALDKESCGDVPDADDRVQRTGGDESAIWGDAHRRHAGVDRVGFVDRHYIHNTMSVKA